MLAAGLLEEQLARPARQAKHIEGLIDRRQRGFLNILDLAEQTILLSAQRGSLLIEELLRDAPIEFVHVHGPNTGFDLLVAGMEPLDCFRTRPPVRFGRT